MTTVVNQLCSSMKIERDNGVNEMQKMLPALTEVERLTIESTLLHLLGHSENQWETKQGCLLGAKALVPYLNTEDERELDFVSNMKAIAEKMLTDLEVRVRVAAGDFLGALCGKIGPEIYQDTREYILHLVQTNLDRQTADDDASRQEQLETEKLMEKLAGPSQRRNSAEAIQIFQDTAGWKNLETILHCLQAMIEGCGAQFQPYVDEELLNLVFQTLTHPNCFVRETGFSVCSSLVGCGSTDQDMEERDSVSVINPIFAFGHEFSKHLGCGLADNSSQVRLASSIAARKFLLSLPEKSREVFYPELLPKMCLNRYYIAEGVRLYSQETWRQVAGVAGQELVEKHIIPTVEYYVAATLSDNYAVREAACACIAELATKLDCNTLKPHVGRLLQALLACFQDDSWAVRDAACLACGNFVLSFPEETQTALPSLLPLFFRNLEDCIASVRQGAACALSSVVRAFGREALNPVSECITQGLTNIRNQPAVTQVSVDNDSKSFGSTYVRQAIGNDIGSHSEQQMFPGNPLSPHLSYCSNIDTKLRPSQPWELADGCVYLLAELSQIPEAVSSVATALPLVAEACRHRHYTQHMTFLETVCKQLPLLAKGLGKKVFKTVLEDFFEPIFYALECENALTSSASSQCLNQLGTLIGPNILRAKVEQYNPRYLHHLDANVYIAPF